MKKTLSQEGLDPGILHALHETPWEDLLWLALADNLEEIGMVEQATILRIRQECLGGDTTRQTEMQDLLNRGVLPFVLSLPDPVTKVTFSVLPCKPFLAVGVIPITIAQWNRYKTPASLGNIPQVNISWEDVTTWISRTPKKRGGIRGTYCLPQNEEWEYACRAGTTTDFHYGDQPSKNNMYYEESSLGSVGRYPPNAFGLYDMHGNVWEWCEDLFPRSSYRVFRGGGWYSDGQYCRSAFRISNGPTSRFSSLGFRLALKR